MSILRKLKISKIAIGFFSLLLVISLASLPNDLYQFLPTGNFFNDNQTKPNYFVKKPSILSTQVTTNLKPKPVYKNEKKLIQIGWDLPTAPYVKAHIAEIESKPFDGIVFVPGYQVPSLFDPTDWSNKTEFIDSKTLLLVKWNKFKHNFLLLHPKDEYGMEYFNDNQWRVILNNIRALAKAVKASGSVGIMFDPEAFASKSPWSYEEHKEGNTSRSKVEAQVRLRGSQFMAALQQEMPNIKILFTYMLSHVPKRWEMYPIFVSGMLDAAQPEVRLIDGREESYYWASTNKWFEPYDDKTSGRSKYLDATNKTKWNYVVQEGRAVYADLLWGRYIWENYKWKASYQDILKRWQHNIYYGLATTDEYVWLYGEGLAWRENSALWNESNSPMGQNWKRDDIWLGAEEGVATATNKYRTGVKLGWDQVGAELANSNFSRSDYVNVRIATPINGSMFDSSINIAVNVEANGGQISRVDLYQNTVKFGEVRTSPYQFTLNNLSPGSYTFIARAFNSVGMHGTSNPVTITVGRLKVSENK